MLTPDLTIKEVTGTAHDPCSVCQRRAGGERPQRFFLVAGQGVSATYCRPCLTIAQAMARRQRERRKGVADGVR